MTTQTTGLKVAKDATKSNPKTESAKAETTVKGESKDPREALKMALAVYEEKADLLRHRENLIKHLDKVSELNVETKDDFSEEGRTLEFIRLRDKEGNTYDISNPRLLQTLVITLKKEIISKVEEVEKRLVA